MSTKAEKAVELARLIFELQQELKKLEKEMSLKEFIAYVEGTRA